MPKCFILSGIWRYPSTGVLSKSLSDSLNAIHLIFKYLISLLKPLHLKATYAHFLAKCVQFIGMKCITTWSICFSLFFFKSVFISNWQALRLYSITVSFAGPRLYWWSIRSFHCATYGLHSYESSNNFYILLLLMNLLIRN